MRESPGIDGELCERGKLGFIKGNMKDLLGKEGREWEDCVRRRERVEGRKGRIDTLTDR